MQDVIDAVVPVSRELSVRRPGVLSQAHHQSQRSSVLALGEGYPVAVPMRRGVGNSERVFPTRTYYVMRRLRSAPPRGT